MTEQQNISSNSSSKRGILWIFTILLVGAALAGGGYFGWHFINNTVGRLETGIEESFAEVKQLQNRLDQLQNGLQTLHDEVQKVNTAKDRNWRPAIIEHLINMANLTLNTTGEVKLATSFLLLAKQYATTPELSAINHTVNKDIASLQAIPVVDNEALILQLENLNQKIGSLPIVTAEFTKAPKAQPEEVSHAKTLWLRFFEKAGSALKDMVTIRHQTVEPLLLPEQETILRLNIQTKLLQAELAVMHRQNKLYQACLAQVTTLVTNYFATNSTVKDDILPALQELQKVNLQPQLPLLTESIAAITNFISSDKKQSNKQLLTLDTQGGTPL